MGCFALDELESSTSSTTTWVGAMALEKCSRACAGSAALYTSGDTCGCLDAKPSASTHHPAYFCNQPCSADVSQLCGANAQVCATEVLQLPEGCDPNVPGDCVCPSYMLPASVYHLPSTLTSSPGDGSGNSSGACSFARSSARTPLLESVSPRTAAFNATLELRGTGFLSSGMLDMVGRETRCDAWCATATELNADGAPKAWDQRCFRESALSPGVYPCAGCPECGPTVTVCGGRDCAVEFYNETYMRCRMPMCSATANESTQLHVLTVGYAAAPSGTGVAGTLQVASVASAGASGGGMASGSAAGGRVLTITGEGFDDQAARMQVLLLSGGDTLARCLPISSSSVRGTLTCRVEPSGSPLSDAGTLCDVRVALLSGSGDMLNTSDAAASYQMLSSDSSPLVEVQSSAGGSELGGASLCLHGQRLNGSRAAVAIAGVPCPLVRANDTATANETTVCCLTPAFAAGASPAALNLTISVPEVGDALLAAGVAGTFTYGAPPAVTGLSPAAAHVGSTVHLQEP